MKRYDGKLTRIVHDEIVNEEIIFKGKKIIREKIVKKWSIPKIIRDDYTYQMQFGWQPAPKSYNSKNTGIEERHIDI